MLLFFVLLVSSFKFLVSPINAADEFNLSQNTTYSISTTGEAKVTVETRMTNNYSEIYAKEYQVNLTGNNLKNINGHDDYGSIISSTDISGDQTSIHLKFNQPQLGKNKVTKFTLSYTIPDFATKKGNTWELTLPEIKSISDYQDYDLTLLFPSSFGSIAYASIPLHAQASVGNQSQISLKKSDIENKKILLVFGNYQLFNFELKYFLQNSTQSPITTKIAIPPDTSHQQVTFTSIEPKPVDISVDQDGNWLAQYYLDPNQTIEAVASGQVKILPNSLNIPHEPVNNDVYTSSQEFWPVDDPSITQIASNLKTPKQIYDYVVATLSYNYSQIDQAKRQGATAAIRSPQSALCTEFTDLFITIARANKIPAREIEGYAYTNNPKIKPTNPNTDILHAWPQYFDSKSNKWISIDPTWGKTTNGINFFSDLDLNHFTFVTHGLNSQYPPPPGSYRHGNTKTVTVDLATQEIPRSNLPPVITFSKSFPPKLFIENPNQNAIRSVAINSPLLPTSKQINLLPPLTQIEIKYQPLPFLKSLLPSSTRVNFAISYDQESTSVLSPSYPYHFFYLVGTIGIAIIILSIGGIIITVPRKKVL